jgi:quercetin dioxygenase-like cupin family protein
MSTHPPSNAQTKRLILSRTEAGGFYFLRERESDWEPAGFPGADVRRLFIDLDDGSETRLLRLTPSAPPDALPSLAGHDFYVISGHVQADGAHLQIGDYLHAGGQPPAGRSEQGCVLFTILEGRQRRAGGSPTRITVRASDGEWVDADPGAFTKWLGADPARGLEILLLRMEPGAQFAAHRHEGDEEMFVLRGDCRCQGHTLHPGDYHRAASGSRHDTANTKAGCKLILVRHLPI